jgi:hypothetical protein
MIEAGYPVMYQWDIIPLPSFKTNRSQFTVNQQVVLFGIGHKNILVVKISIKRETPATI